MHYPIFQRLPQHLESIPGEFRKLVEEEDAMMGKTHLALLRNRAAAKVFRYISACKEPLP